MESLKTPPFLYTTSEASPNYSPKQSKTNTSQNQQCFPCHIPEIAHYPNSNHSSLDKTLDLSIDSLNNDNNRTNASINTNEFSFGNTSVNIPKKEWTQINIKKLEQYLKYEKGLNSNDKKEGLNQGLSLQSMWLNWNYLELNIENYFKCPIMKIAAKSNSELTKQMAKDNEDVKINFVSKCEAELIKGLKKADQDVESVCKNGKDVDEFWSNE